ncbi:rhomboid family intramembrane serine protease [Halorientalis brevis]|uniref:Rhomboid family intramembrane serine protease n=1 Tax=Halorientalis brevis TaxID=1126241 RepID=A0ABD6C667_9EURY|nr:rhomboid family intramembrane serine protease [Halorientalis brevis]
MVSARSPTLTTITLFVVVFAVETVARLLGVFPALFVLAPPVTTNPWTIVTSVYAHSGPVHLLWNAIALLLPGFILEHQTSELRYHAFFVAAGATAGVAEITIGPLLGSPAGVLGASGAVFAFIGYLLSANRLAEAAIGGVELSGRTQLLAFVILAIAVTVATGQPGVALIAHFTGFLVGLLAGRAHLLRRSPDRSVPSSR